MLSEREPVSPDMIHAVRSLRLSEIVGRSVKLVREGHDHVGLCPFHQERSPSFTVTDSRGLWICFGCEASGDVISFFQRMYGLRFRAAVEYLAKDNGLTALVPAVIEKARRANEEQDRREIRKKDLAKRIWSEAGLAGDIVRSYLASRGITIDPPATLREHTNTRHDLAGTWHPAMIAPIVIWPSREIVAIHRTYLTPEGRKITAAEAKLTLGKRKAGAIPLAPAGEHMAITEGIETGLTVQQCFGIPTWSGICAGGIKSMRLPDLPLARVVTIYADNDHNGTGERAAENAADIWAEEGREVFISMPPETGTDWNDVLMRSAA